MTGGDEETEFVDVDPRPDSRADQHAPQRTAHAQDAMAFDTMFALRFNERRYGRGPSRKVSIGTPVGMSTSGGAQARQSLVLAPDGEALGSGKIVCGFVDTAKNVALLRSFEFIGAYHLVRFKTTFAMERDVYEQMLNDVAEFAQIHGFNLKLIEPATGAVPSPAQQAGGPPSVIWMVIGVLVFGVLLGLLLAR